MVELDGLKGLFPPKQFHSLAIFVALPVVLQFVNAFLALGSLNFKAALKIWLQMPNRQG